MKRSDICKAFSNEERLKLIVCLSHPQNVTELLGHCTLAQSALSQHLKVLRDAKIVVSKKIGKQIIYKVSSKKATKVASLLLNYK